MPAAFPRFSSHSFLPSGTPSRSLADCAVPVLIVHGEKDTLFPVQMARDLAAMPPRSRLIAISNLGHSEPFHKPQLSYWGHIIRFLAD